jgi:hypothetical protein
LQKREKNKYNDKKWLHQQNQKGNGKQNSLCHQGQLLCNNTNSKNYLLKGKQVRTDIDIL